MRKAQIERTTMETNISLQLDLDGSGIAQIKTGIGFFDHMLTSLTFHSGMDLAIQCGGDLEVDGHHTVEDVGIVLGQAIREALGDRIGITRFGHMVVPMDDALAMATIDISNRPYLVFGAAFSRDQVGDLDMQNIKEFFQALVNESRINLHLNLMAGDNAHHQAEALFKAFAKALSQAAAVTSDRVVSTKGVL